ncbi:MFS transporter [Oerskovia sp. M15]
MIFASLIGTSIEFYDFYAYATAAVLVFPAVFFSALDGETSKLLASFAVFGVAFVARPLGSIVFGHYGDRIGRKGTLVASLLTMGVATFLIGLLPPSTTPGGPSSPRTAGRHALLPGPRARRRVERRGAARDRERSPGKRAIWGTFPQLGAPIGFILANTTFLILAETLSEAQFAAWGWRVPFLASAILVIVGLWVRLKLVETPAFQKVVETGVVAKLPVAQVFRSSWRKIVLGTFIMLATYVLFYLMTTFTLTFGTAAATVPAGADAAPGSATSAPTSS